MTNSRTDALGAITNTVTYQEIGIILNVIPHINPEGLVIMDVQPQISALTGQTIQISENLSSPVYAMRQAQSRVAIKNGQTIVIGGLMEDRKTDTVNKVPLIGDIPWLGELFQHKNTIKSKTELLIFLTPHVAADNRELRDISGKEERGVKLVPGAIDKGEYGDQMDAMRRGTTRPAE